MVNAGSYGASAGLGAGIYGPAGRGLMQPPQEWDPLEKMETASCLKDNQRWVVSCQDWARALK